MATFTFGTPPLSVEFDDRTLAHLRAVIVAKLRRSESFLFSWDAVGTGTDVGPDGTGTGTGTGTGPITQESVWVHPAIGLHFRIDQAALVGLNRDWLDLLTSSANSNGGLRVLAEPTTTPVPRPAAAELVVGAPRKTTRASTARA